MLLLSERHLAYGCNLLVESELGRRPAHIPPHDPPRRVPYPLPLEQLGEHVDRGCPGYQQLFALDRGVGEDALDGTDDLLLVFRWIASRAHADFEHRPTMFERIFNCASIG